MPSFPDSPGEIRAGPAEPDRDWSPRFRFSDRAAEAPAAWLPEPGFGRASPWAARSTERRPRRFARNSAAPAKPAQRDGRTGALPAAEPEPAGSPAKVG